MCGDMLSFFWATSCRHAYKFNLVATSTSWPSGYTQLLAVVSSFFFHKKQNCSFSPTWSFPRPIFCTAQVFLDLVTAKGSFPRPFLYSSGLVRPGCSYDLFQDLMVSFPSTWPCRCLFQDIWDEVLYEPPYCFSSLALIERASSLLRLSFSKASLILPIKAL